MLKGLLPGRRRYEDEWRTVYVLNKYPSNEPDVEVKQKRYASNVIVTSKVSLTITNLQQVELWLHSSGIIWLRINDQRLFGSW